MKVYCYEFDYDGKRMNVKEHYRTIAKISMGKCFGVIYCNMWFQNGVVGVDRLNAWGEGYNCFYTFKKIRKKELKKLEVVME